MAASVRKRTDGGSHGAYRAGRMDAPAPYIHWGFILISLPNLLLICTMVLIFVIALVAPFPGHKRNEDRDD